MKVFLFYNYLPKLATHILDVRYTSRIVHHNYPEFKIENIKDNDIIFVKTDLLPLFFKKYYSLIKCHFYLINGSSDLEIDHNYLKYLNEDKIIMWMGCNISLEHKKILKIPIGFEENELPGGDQLLLNIFYNNKLPFENKINKLLITSMRNTHASRSGVKSLLDSKDFCICLNKRLTFENFMNELNKYKFILSPRGNGIDTHRFWEILLVGSVPIVETSGLDSLYSKFPCIIVNSFEDINEELLDSYQYDFERQKNIKKYLITNDFNNMIYKKIEDTKLDSFGTAISFFSIIFGISSNIFSDRKKSDSIKLE